MEINDIYRCSKCGNIVETLNVGGGALVCCGQPMELLKANTTDASKEKHVPVIERTADGVIVKIGSIPHPMETGHYIQWIELFADGIVHRKHLKPGDKPEAMFSVKGNRLNAREYCNLHGLWKA